MRPVLTCSFMLSSIGTDVWEALRTKGPSPRHEIFYSPVVAGDPATSLNPEDCASWGQSCGGALRVDDYKIIVGCPSPFMFACSCFCFTCASCFYFCL